MDDREIVALYLRRQEDAIARTDEKYRWLCFRLAENILPRREDQEECVNDAYLGLWNTIRPRSHSGWGPILHGLPEALPLTGGDISRLGNGAVDRLRVH